MATRKADAEDDVVEIRPFKRSKATSSAGKPTSLTDSQQEHMAPNRLEQDAITGATGKSLTFLKDWHRECKAQGGWLFDILNKQHHTMNGIREGLEKKLETVHNILGQSMNASSANEIAELYSITKLVHWLEHCRSTSAVKV
jgi:hypothetical protein